MRKLLLLAALSAALSTPARAALSTTNSVITYTSNGATTSFATTFRFLNTSHLVVTKTDLSAVTTTLTLGTDYSVTGANAAAGGTVTLVAAIPVNWTLKIKRSTPKTQACNFRSQGAFQAKTFEDCLDIVEMQIQEMNDGTFTQLLATPVTTAQASTAAPIAIPNAANTNDVGTSASFAKADHVHQCAAASSTQTGCVTTGSQTIAGVKTFATGIGADGGGYKHARVGTGSVTAGSRADVVVTWGTAFANTNYTPVCVMADASAAGTGLRVERVRALAAASITVQVINDSGGSLTGTVYCQAAHD
jgi:hypothetical protein